MKKKLFLYKLLLFSGTTVLFLTQNTRVHAISLDFNLGKKLVECRQMNDLEPIKCLVVSVTQFALDLMGALAFIMILYASITYLTSYGDENKTEVAKKTLIWSVIGIIIVGVARVILNVINTKFAAFS